MYQKRGFTLIELLVVVLIIGILSAVALPQYQKAVTKSRYVQAMTIGDSIARAVSVYYMANGAYPNSLEDLDITFPGELSDDKRKITFNEYQCALFTNSSASDSILCSRGGVNNAQYLGFRVMFSPSGNYSRVCVAYEGNESAANLCTSLGGELYLTSEVGLRHYRLK